MDATTTLFQRHGWDIHALCAAGAAGAGQTGSIPAGSKRGNRRRKNIVALCVRYSYHGFMAFWTAAKRYGCINPSSQLEAALNARTVAM